MSSLQKEYPDMVTPTPYFYHTNPIFWQAHHREERNFDGENADRFADQIPSTKNTISADRQKEDHLRFKKPAKL